MDAARELEGAVALITGGARNIGRAIAQALAAQGVRVVINARTSAQAAQETVQSIEAAGGLAMVAMGDVTDPAQVEQMVASVLARWGRIDILVNNANTHGVKAFEDLTLEDWRRTVTVALEAPFLCMKACYPLMIRQGGGTIVNIGGSAGHMPYDGRVPVSAAKAGLAGMTRAMAYEGAKHGITVNCIAPGPVNTVRSVPSKSDPKRIPLQRFAEADEVAHLVRMLCAPKGRYITGQTLHVNGGLYMNN
ncbi:MAG: SDR family NAD(P)-dependent oxidoreductase [bacterium]|jgi:3-oxoacyl-[acyl-carrier protein] reductase|nr:3-oxoacyl-ACP reductase FabG [Betaproteobacteria bacterium]